MSQFRSTGAGYCSQWGGDDLNAGTDPTLPKASIASFASSTANKIIVGAGVYGIWTGSRWLAADGKVIIDMGGGSISAGGIYEGVHFINGSQLLPNIFNNVLTDCIIESVSSLGARASHIRSVLIGSSTTSHTQIASFQNSMFFGSYISAGTSTTIACCYLEKEKTIRYGASVSNIDSCLNGFLNVSGTLYEAKLLIDGSPRTDADPLVPDIVSVFPNFYTQGNFACLEADLKFIDVLSRTVSADSILLQKSNLNGYIGGVKVGKSIALDEEGFTITKEGIDDSNPNSWKVASDVDFAKVRMVGKVSDSLISSQTLEIIIPFNFNGSAAGGSASNNNVPDAWNDRVTPDTKGTRPNRLTFEVRSSVLSNAIPDNDGDWDNDNTNSPSLTGRYYLMEYGQPLMHHVISSVTYGNADSNAINAAVKIPFNYRSLDIIITITNDREI